MFEQSQVLTAVKIPRRLKVTLSTRAGTPKLPQLVGGWENLLKVSVSTGPFLTLFFTYFFFGHCQGKDPGLEGCLVTVTLEVLALYGWCTAAHRFNSPGFQKASNSPTCCPDGKLAVTLLYPGNTPRFMKLWSALYSRFLLIPVLTLLTCLPTAPQISP